MNMYSTPLDGLYNFKTPRFDGTFNIQQVKVSVLGESSTMYRIRLRLPVGNRRYGDEMSVRKHNVHVHRPAPQPKEYDYTESWWNN